MKLEQKLTCNFIYSDSLLINRSFDFSPVLLLTLLFLFLSNYFLTSDILSQKYPANVLGFDLILCPIFLIIPPILSSGIIKQEKLLLNVTNIFQEMKMVKAKKIVLHLNKKHSIKKISMKRFIMKLFIFTSFVS